MLPGVISPTLMLQLGHGDEAVETLLLPWNYHQSFNRFNWATAMKPWRRASVMELLDQLDRLQLGHGDEAVETRIPLLLCAACDTCFNWATAMKPWRH